MSWTSPYDIGSQVQKLWDKGLLLSCLSGGESLFPLQLKLRKPTSAELSDRFDDVRKWIADLNMGEHYRLVMKEVRHQIIGSNIVPAEIWIDTLDDALALIGKNREAEQLKELVEITKRRQPALLLWIAENSLKLLQMADVWSLLLDITDWMKSHPRPGIYLRQIELHGINTKFIETHRAVLMELLDIIMPPGSIDIQAIGVKQFCRRYGFLDKPLRIRFRILDPALYFLPTDTDQDISVNQDTLDRLDLKVSRVFITENEINFLAFPKLRDSMVLFGSGYGVEMLSSASWLQRCPVYYWGDIDTHGFAILDKLRLFFPHAESFLMNRDTLMSHKKQWVTEPQPLRRDLTRLRPEEKELFDDLCQNRFGSAVRLEQERIGFGYVKAALSRGG